MTLDARLPIRFGPLHSRTAGEALISDTIAGAEPPAATFTIVQTGHLNGCLCCMPRTGAALALASLFRTRATSNALLFGSVLAVVTPGGEAALRAALSNDVMAAARYRLA